MIKVSDDGWGPMAGWLSAAEELDAYEGIWRGDGDAFRAIAEPLQPTLRRLACLYIDSTDRVDAVVLRTWESALGGLHLFHWHTPLATWIAKLTVGCGRRHATAHAPAVPRSPAEQEAPGPPDWSDLPWGARWLHAGATLTSALAALPTSLHEVVHGRDIEQWPPQRVCDVFGLPRTTYQQRLHRAHIRLHDSLAPLVGQTGPSPHRPAQIAAITAWLNQRVDDHPEPLDPRVLEIFQRWAPRRPLAWTGLSQWLRGSSPPRWPLTEPAGAPRRRRARTRFGW